MSLEWDTAATDEPRDQNATSQRVHGYWALGPTHTGTWSVELIELNDESDEIEGGGVDLGSFPTEDLAKGEAEHYESTGIVRPLFVSDDDAFKYLREPT